VLHTENNSKEKINAPTKVPLLILVVLLYKIRSKITAAIPTTMATPPTMIAMIIVLECFLLFTPQLVEESTLSLTIFNALDSSVIINQVKSNFKQLKFSIIQWDNVLFGKWKSVLPLPFQQKVQ
jgi:hypothetical protein